MKAGTYEYEEDGEKGAAGTKKPNGLPIWGNEKTMNLNPLILTNIQSSQYFKVNLYKLKTYHEVIDEIYYNVSHLEPWEKGSRKTSGQTGMCGGVRGVGAGGIVSTAFCILYKLYTLRLTRKQVIGLINHSDSPYIRGLGFMYVRFTQPPADLWDWFDAYLDDEEEIDVRAGGGQTTTIGQVVRNMLTKLDWYSTLFPRIPVPIQKDLEKKLAERAASRPVVVAAPVVAVAPVAPAKKESGGGEYGARDRDWGNKDSDRDRSRGRDRDNGQYQEQQRNHVDNSKSRSREHNDRNGEYERPRDRHRDKGRDHRERDHDHRERDHDRHRHKDSDKRKSRSRSHDRKHHHRSDRQEERDSKDFADLLEREKYRIKKERKGDSSRGERERHHRSRSRDRERRHRY